MLHINRNSSFTHFWLIFLILASSFGLVFGALAAPLVKPGIDQLNEPLYLNQIKNKRLGLLTNSAGVNAAGTSTIDVLFHNKKVKLLALFSAEHGLREHSDTTVADSKDPVTHLPIYSLYGPRKVPSADEFAKIDAIVIDLQDVGLRYYTYATTMALIMQAAKHYHKLVVILDRPNPLNGNRVEGPLLNPKFTGHFAAYYPIPLRHGLTMGELAEYFNRFFHIHCHLLVIPMSGWHRWMLFNQTGLAWHAPSPALPTFQQTFLYGMFGSLESLDLAVGRGETNHRAFKIYGAPWINADQDLTLVKKLNQDHLAGLAFRVYTWTPERGIYRNQICHGFQVKITHLADINTFYSLLTVLETLYQQFGHALKLSQIDGMLGQAWVREAIENHQPVLKILEKVHQEQQSFLLKRKTVLIYH